jgi:hypothetical protein
MMYAANAYAKIGRLVVVIDIDGTEKVTPVIISECQKTPQSPFLQKLKAVCVKVKADTKAEMNKIE